MSVTAKAKIVKKLHQLCKSSKQPKPIDALPAINKSSLIVIVALAEDMEASPPTRLEVAQANLRTTLQVLATTLAEYTRSSTGFHSKCYALQLSRTIMGRMMAGVPSSLASFFKRNVLISLVLFCSFSIIRCSISVNLILLIYESHLCMVYSCTSIPKIV
jgi:hypothetical protein